MTSLKYKFSVFNELEATCDLVIYNIFDHNPPLLSKWVNSFGEHFDRYYNISVFEA